MTHEVGDELNLCHASFPTEADAWKFIRDSANLDSENRQN